jgi:hypothetical protein
MKLRFAIRWMKIYTAQAGGFRLLPIMTGCEKPPTSKLTGNFASPDAVTRNSIMVASLESSGLFGSDPAAVRVATFVCCSLLVYNK